MGDVFNPAGSPFGAFYDRKEHRAVGDLKMLTADENGRVSGYFYKDSIASLYGENSIIGRGMVIFAKPDDLSHQNYSTYAKAGNTSARSACCTIALSSGPATN